MKNLLNIYVYIVVVVVVVESRPFCVRAASRFIRHHPRPFHPLYQPVLGLHRGLLENQLSMHNAAIADIICNTGF